MKCPECGVWSHVRQTLATERHRECANGHRFVTEEVVKVPRSALKNADIASRNKRIVSMAASGASWSQITEYFGVSKRVVQRALLHTGEMK